MANNGLTVNEDNTEQVKQGIADGIQRALEMIGLAGESFAKQDCPVDTGRLRNSITHVTDGDKSVYIGTNVEYAAYVELGTVRTRPQPYLRPAAVNNVDKYRSILKSCLENG